MISRGGLEPASWSSNPSGQLCGKYHVIAQLGRGGMADVYLAVARGPGGFNKLQVLKQLSPARCAEPDLLAMFLDEASFAARLNHPNVVQVNEVGRDGDTYFIAMEYLEGQPLVRIVRRLYPNGLPHRVLLRIIADACAGLHYVHTLTDFDGTPLGAVHRDVSPHNLFVTYGGHVKLVDFGIAKAANRSTDTQVGMLKGKITYMSPEQIQGAEVDARSDVFSLGVVLYEGLTRERLWGNHPQEVDILRRLVSGDVPSSPRQVLPSVPEDLDRICQRALAVERELRYSSALEMQQDLEEAIARLPERASEREIGEIVSTLFAEERRAIAAIIDKQIRALRSAPDGDLAKGNLPTLGHAGVISVTPSRLQAIQQSDTTLAAETPQSRTRALLAAVVGLFCLVLVLTLRQWLPSSEAPAPAPAEPTVKQAVGALKPPTEAPPAPDPPLAAALPAIEPTPMAPTPSAAPSAQRRPKRRKPRPSDPATASVTPMTTIPATSTFGPLDGRK